MEEIMKIAVATDKETVSEHFGHCTGFTVFETKGKEIMKEEFFENPGHKPGFLPNFLKEKGVQTVISGGMGAGAIELFKDNKIEVIVGISGDCKQVVKQYLIGQLVSTESVCSDHINASECGNH